MFYDTILEDESHKDPLVQKLKKDQVGIHLDEYSNVAEMVLSNCPKMMTIATHTATSRDDLLYAQVSPKKNIDGDKLYFIVPKQRLITKDTSTGKSLIIFRVTEEKSKKKYWMVVCEWNRRGLLIELDKLDEKGDVVK